MKRNNAKLASSQHQHNRYCSQILIAALVLFTTFALPLSSTQAADSNPINKTEMLNVQDILSATQSWIAQSLQAKLAINGRVEFSPTQLDPRLQLKRCSQPLHFSTPANNNSYTTRLLVKVRCEGETPWAIYVPFTVKHWQTVAVATRSIPRNTVIHLSDIDIQEVELTRPGNDFFYNTEQVIGLITKRGVNRGQTLSMSNMKQPMVIKRGDEVIIVADNAGITVKMNGMAMSDGKRNQQIQVKNLSSKRLIKAKVVSAGKVSAIM